MSKNIIRVTDKALHQLKKIIKKTDYNYFDLSLKNGGCSGFEYKLMPKKKNVDSLINNHKSTKIKPEIYKKDDIEIEICNKSLMYLFGTEIDWEEDIISKKFIFNNPNAKAKCGCGTSFSPF